MLCSLIPGFLLLCCSIGFARAANCTFTSYTNQLTNGQTADANQVMGNFNQILGCANGQLAPLANPAFTGTITGTGNGSGYTATNPYGGGLDLTTNDTHSWQIRVDNGSLTGQTDAFVVRDGTVGAVRIFVGTSGNVGIGTTSPSATLYVNGSAGSSGAWGPSDARLKKNIEPLVGALSLIERLRPVRFEWKEPKDRLIGKDLSLPLNRTQIGFVAQEVQTVVPEAVVVPQNSSDPYGMLENGLTPILVEAMKEQQAEIDELKETVAKLKERE